jgi:benzoylformate decarboxylase
MRLLHSRQQKLKSRTTRRFFAVYRTFFSLPIPSRKRMNVSGAEALVEILHGYGVRHIFGNPGTTELPLSDVLAGDHRLQYILGLQEIPVMAMADGLAMASRSLAVANVHVCCGLGNAMGMLYNAFREGTPLLVTAGQQDRRLRRTEPILAGDMVAVARPWTKWAAEVEHLPDLPGMVQQAIRHALTPPTGPVFLSLPLDLQMERGEIDVAVPSLSLQVAPPSRESLARAVQVLASAKRPAILAGSRIVERDAVQELVSVAEILGAPVYGEPAHTNGRQPFPANHPLYGQTLPHWSPEIAAHLQEFDALLVVGMDLFRLYVYSEPSCPISPGVHVVHLDEDSRQLSKNVPTEVPLHGDTKSGLAELAALLRQTRSDTQASNSAARTEEFSQKHAAERRRLLDLSAAQASVRPAKPLSVMHALSQMLPENVAVIEEAVTTTNTTFQRLGALRNTDGYFAHRGWSLGWGLGCALGVQLAWPKRPVLAILGDGAALYGIQGLWSAAKYRIPATFVVCNNSSYQILKAGAQALGLPQAQAGRFVGLDLTEPAVDIVAVAQGFGVPAVTIENPGDLADAVRESFSAHDGPRLFNIPIERGLKGPGSP